MFGAAMPVASIDEDGYTIWPEQHVGGAVKFRDRPGSYSKPESLTMDS
jgi:hypothetical protein